MKVTSVLCATVFSLWFCASSPGGEEKKELAESLQPLITTSEMVVGTNRYAFGLLKSGRLIADAHVTVRLYSIAASEAKLSGEVEASYQAVNEAKQLPSIHRHSDGTTHTHGDDSNVRGLYVTQLTFDRAGDWGVELLVRHHKTIFEPVRFAVTVQESPLTPAVGSLAPRSRNLIARDVKNLREIDTSPRPDARLHQVRIADALAQGKPQLIVFATPQFCTSRMCGPVVDIVRRLLPVWGKRVALIHQEIWQDFAEKKMFSTVGEWRLDTEPWVFIVDGKGIIRAKFEGLVTERELEIALQQVLTREPSKHR